jgi:hypothetical protein
MGLSGHLCEGCGASQRPGARFCSSCGKPLKAARPTASRSGARRTVLTLCDLEIDSALGQLAPLIGSLEYEFGVWVGEREMGRARASLASIRLHGSLADSRDLEPPVRFEFPTGPFRLLAVPDQDTDAFQALWTRFRNGKPLLSRGGEAVRQEWREFVRGTFCLVLDEVATTAELRIGLQFSKQHGVNSYVLE